MVFRINGILLNSFQFKTVIHLNISYWLQLFELLLCDNNSSIYLLRD